MNIKSSLSLIITLVSVTFIYPSVYGQQFTKLETFNEWQIWQGALIKEIAFSKSSNKSLPYSLNKKDSIFSNYYQNRTNKTNQQNTFFLKFRKILFNDNLIKINSPQSLITINPIAEFNVGKGKNETTFINTRGLKVDINIGDNFFVSSYISETLAKYPQHILNYIDSLKVVPGMGAARMQGDARVEYAFPVAYIGYKPNNFFYFEIGNGKNFLGNGNRSLLLSDASYAYPYFKIVTNIGKITYTNLWSQLTDASDGWDYTNGYTKKMGVFNYLSFIPFKNIELSLFQSIIASNKDSLGNVKPTNYGYFIPVIYLNSLNFNQGSPDNSLIGADFNVRIKKRYLLYSQIVIDDFNISKLKEGKSYFQNKYGFQVGLKAFDLFNSLFINIEYNTIRPYTYANKNVRVNYTHYNEPLAHPLGANFKEMVLSANYKYKKWVTDLTLVLYRNGIDSGSNYYGKNINKSDWRAVNGIFSFNNVTGQGIANKVTLVDIKLKYMLNHYMKSNLYLGFFARKEKSILSEANQNFIYFGFATSIYNSNKYF